MSSATPGPLWASCDENILSLSVTLHSHAEQDRFETLDRVLSIFISPTLRYVHVSCLYLDFSLDALTPALETRVGQTPLQTLILDQCIFLDNSLTFLLSFPRALRSLALITVGFRPHTPYGPETHITPLKMQSALSRACIKAIQQQSHSLQYLRYYDPFDRYQEHGLKRISVALDRYCSTMLDSGTGFSSFTSLHTLDICYNGEITSRLFAPHLAPPALRTLGIFGLPLHPYRDWRHIPEYVFSLAACTPFDNLRLFTLSESWHAKCKLFGAHSLQEGLLGVVEGLKDRASVQVISSRTERHNKAPYLYGQHPPKELLFFDSRRARGQKVDGELDQRFRDEPYVYEELGELPSFGSLWNEF